MGGVHSRSTAPMPAPPPSGPSSSPSPPRRQLANRLSSFIRGDVRKRDPPASRRPSSTVDAAPKRRRTCPRSPSAPSAQREQGESDRTPVAGSSRLAAPSSTAPSTSSNNAQQDERPRSLVSVRDALGPEWPAPHSVSPGMERLLSRFRRPAPSPHQPAAASSASLPLPPPRSRAQRLSALLSSRSSPNGSLPSIIAAPNSAEESTLPTNDATSDTPADAAPQSGADERPDQRIPVGAVLVIQGLAQTHGADEDEQAGSPPSLDHQARMIGNLLTVAAAATAATLLAPHVPPQPQRGVAASAMQTILDRIRPNRSNRQRSVEAALGDYLRTVLRDSRRTSPAGIFSDMSPANVTAGFEGFLEGLQGDLVQAIGQFSTPIERDESVETTQQNTGAETTQQHVDSARREQEAPGDANNGASASPNNDWSTIPALHAQPGQIQSSSANSLGVTGGTDGIPRRLNFFRAHLFPGVGPDGSSHASEGPNDVVPSIFVGVRSISHDPSLTTEDLVSHPSFPFNDGAVPPNTAAAGSADVTIEPRRTLRERVIDRLNGRREDSEGQGTVNTYLVYVVGGNYPRSHPILAIPNLLTGAALTDEELQLVGELLGPAKPPTASRDDIEQSGLVVVKGSAVPSLVDIAQIMPNCSERCLICLGDYEPEEDCRVLRCRHAFHQECVDQWISQGRNNCPACRSQAVDKTTSEPTLARAQGGLVATNAPSSDLD